MRRRAFVTSSLGVGTALLAGCTSGGGDQSEEEHSEHGGHDDEETETQTATDGSSTAQFRLLISDRPAAIGDFDSLTVSFSHARVFGGAVSEDDETATATEAAASDGTSTATEMAAEDDTSTETTTEDASTATATATATEDGGGGAQPEEEDEHSEDGDHEEETEAEDEEAAEDDGEDGGFSEFDLEGESVDLTQVVGDAAMSVLDGELSPGRYTKIELHASNVVGIVDGEEAEVKIPSGKLMLTKPFEVAAGESVEFVFDINVVKRGKGNNYNLLPVIGESGVAGTDVEVEEVEAEDEHEDDDDETETEEEAETEEDDETGTTATDTATATEAN